MIPIEIPVDDLKIDALGTDPVYRFEELLNEVNRNDLDRVLHEELQLDINSDHIDDYEIKDDMVVLYVDNEIEE